ncbi:HAMP domain-containing sensor histidine kinase [Massilia sp. W12]|uniref:HAMP domain-containing sensor histidine kinase n=1 Tax=Massilia sp. W12 TaxID=3126507 RepID=UPI0030D226E0
MPEQAAAAPRPGIAWRHRLYLRIYLAVLISLLLSVLLFAWLAQRHNESLRMFPNLAAFSAFAANSLPAADKSEAEQSAVLQRLQELTHADLALYLPRGQLQARAGETLDAPENWNWTSDYSGWLPGLPPRFALKLPDGRWLFGRHRGPAGFMQGPRGRGGDFPPPDFAAPPPGPQHEWQGRRPREAHLPPPHARGEGRGWRMFRFGPPARSLFFILLITALVIAIGAYPVVRRITRRLETLQQSVEDWGRGQLATRVQAQGKDEVASLAHSFNQAAERVEALVAAQKNLLANASHELRSPLARIRMALELDQHDAASRAELARNVHELDQLIEEILLSSRLDSANAQALTLEEVDLTGLLAEECARVDAALELNGAGECMYRGEARLLRRMLRNLLENARRYGHAVSVDADSAPICATIRQTAQGFEIDICDRGPGVPQDERERIFEPFYRARGASEAAGGVGLGLALVRQIAQRHGGAVHCLAREGGGSCFRVQLPPLQA